ncbi:hypothetical protein F5Y04DRAFT_279424 [Hypomontagnella monticulosa]|nr:hypothetical protein F5Y04DRAFT_279424 [Hypomontagnella monticulosa]
MSYEMVPARRAGYAPSNQFPSQFPSQFPGYSPGHFPGQFPNQFPGNLPTTRAFYQNVAFSPQSGYKRDLPLPHLTPACVIPRPSHRDEQMPPPFAFNNESKAFGGYGRKWQDHLSDMRNWHMKIDACKDLPMSENQILTGNRMICMDFLHEHVVCADVCLTSGSEQVLTPTECMALLHRRFLLVPYEEGGVYVNVVYDRRVHAISTFDGIFKDREMRHNNAVEAVRSFVHRSNLPAIPLDQHRIQSAGMEFVPKRYSGYVALEGARTFLRETRAVRLDWGDWVDSNIYTSMAIDLDETHAQATWATKLDEAERAWRNWYM